LISKFGQPISDKTDDSPDGPCEQIVFNDTKGSETFFMLFEKDGTYDGVFYPGGTVSSGCYRGLDFPANVPGEPSAVSKLSPEDRAKEEQDLLFSELNALDKDHTFFQSVQVQGGWAKIVVKDAFHVAPYQSRLQMTQNLVKLWRAIHSPTNGEGAPLTLTDYNGNEVGGTGLTGIWVQKEQ
jgi:hypothetical protein